MKAQTKALLASVVVIALALSAVSGITYSWWSDSENTDIVVTTGYVRVETSDLSVTKGGQTVTGASGSMPEGLQIDYSDTGSTTWYSGSSGATLTVTGDPSERIEIKYKATFSWSVAAKYMMDVESSSISLASVTTMTIDSQPDDVGRWIMAAGSQGNVTHDVTIVITGLPQGIDGATLEIKNHIAQKAPVDQPGILTGGVYQIYNASQLAWVADQVNSGQNTFAGCTVKLMEDINLNGLDWIPIGSENGFKGTFDGNNKTISNLKVSGSQSAVTSASGLFGWIGNKTGVGGDSRPVVKDLTIDGADISGHSYVGGIVGYLEDGDVTRCTVKNSLIENTWRNGNEGGDKTGGIVGFTNPGPGPVVSYNTVKNVDIIGCRDLGMVSGTLYPEVTMENNMVLGTNSIKFSAIDPSDSTHSNGNIGVIAGRLLNGATVDSSNEVIGSVDSDSNSPESLNTLIESGATKIVLTSDVDGTIGSLKSVVQRNLEIDLNGKTLTTSESSYDPHDGMGGRIYLVGKGATLTIKDGKMNFTSGGDYAFLVFGGGQLSLDNVVISTTGNNLLTPQTANSSAEYGQVPSKITIKNSTLSAKESVFYVGTGNKHHSCVNIENSHLMVTSDGIERDSRNNVTGHHNVNVIRLLSDVALKMVGGSLSVDSEYGQALHTRYGNDVVLEDVEFKLHNQSNAVAVWGCDSSIELIDCSTDSLTNAVLVKIPKTLYYSDGSVGVYETDYKSDCFLEETIFDGQPLSETQRSEAQGAGVHLA